MKVLFTGGGTGGHVYPALAVVDALKARDDLAPVEIAWVGRSESVEQGLVQRHGLSFMPITTGALRGRSLPQRLRTGLLLIKGIFEALRLIRRFRPEAVFSTGGYVSAPLTIASWLSRVPVVIYLPDLAPGLAIKALARWATAICVSFESVAQYFDRNKVVVTGYPVRRQLWETDPSAARERLGLEPERPVLLVLGGSTGARSINDAVSVALEGLLAQCQVVHVTGPADLDRLLARAKDLAADKAAGYHLYGYLHEEMVDALASANLVVSRAGASTLAEFPAVGLPAVLVPYPYAGPNQGVNAAFLVERGGAVLIKDQDLQASLLQEVTRLLSDGLELERMSTAMQAIAVRDAAERLVTTLVAVTGRRYRARDGN
ncbi:MAG: undecaprenyldiphospho-muramoylpentapeptide beta-N-acetylglucosaminyltransferase [Anaerolineae bacterium]|jgi:undecaprenyldiphospho-muramoylpentapeptide beta-N-acetylglucosaminyltransferase|nr:undecaprenyldiphospho-muramoylpentapeptide beta-N-acetylglucosaminyltransferase [Chloroflexota bacterium]